LLGVIDSSNFEKHVLEEKQEIVVFSVVVLINHSFVMDDTKVVDSFYSRQVGNRVASLVPPEKRLDSINFDSRQI